MSFLRHIYEWTFASGRFCLTHVIPVQCCWMIQGRVKTTHFSWWTSMKTSNLSSRIITAIRQSLVIPNNIKACSRCAHKHSMMCKYRLFSYGFIYYAINEGWSNRHCFVLCSQSRVQSSIQSSNSASRPKHLKTAFAQRSFKGFQLLKQMSSTDSSILHWFRGDHPQKFGWNLRFDHLSPWTNPQWRRMPQRGLISHEGFMDVYGLNGFPPKGKKVREKNRKSLQNSRLVQTCPNR